MALTYSIYMYLTTLPSIVLQFTAHDLLIITNYVCLFISQTKFADPLGGTTAAEDLMESFGFEGEVEESRQSSASSPSIMGPTGPVSGMCI